MIGKRLAERYELIELLGRGASSSVYRALDTVLNRHVAVKISSGDVPEPHANQTMREARALASLAHPHLVTVYDAGYEEHRGYVVMELVSGGTFASLLNRQTVLSAESTLLWMLPVLSAAAYLHAKGVVHRDLKPQNIVLDEMSGTCKVVDLGIAKELADPCDSGLASGTPHYMSPEEARGLAVTSASDVWSLGVCLFRALTGTFPFVGKTACEVVADVVHRPAPSVFSVKPELSVHLGTVIDRALSRNVANRFTDAEQLAHALVVAAEVDGIVLPETVQCLPCYAAWRHEAVTLETAKLELEASEHPVPPLLLPSMPAPESVLRIARSAWAGTLAFLAVPGIIVLWTSVSPGSAAPVYASLRTSQPRGAVAATPTPAISERQSADAYRSDGGLRNAMMLAAGAATTPVPRSDEKSSESGHSTRTVRPVRRRLLRTHSAPPSEVRIQAQDREPSAPPQLASWNW